MSVNSLNQESEEFLLDEKAVILKQSAFNQADVSSYEDSIPDAENYGSKVSIRYFEMQIGGTNVRIFSTPPNSWANPLAAPNIMTEGRYVAYEEEAIISDDFAISMNVATSAPIKQTVEVGSYISINASASNSLNLYISGKFTAKDKSNIDPGYVWLFLHEETFDDLVGALTVTEYYYSVTYIADGSTMLAGLLGDAYTNLQELYTDVSDYAASDAAWATPENLRLEAKKTSAQLREILFIIGVVGGMIASSLYAYLISRFRRREVAVLKALGYSNNNIRIVLLAEIITVTLLGFFIGLILLQLSLVFTTTHTSYTPNLFARSSTWLAFAIVVISNVIAFLIISQRTSSIKTMELFRGA